MTNYNPHESVLAQECLHTLSPHSKLTNEEFWMIDCTFGAGGHSFLFLSAYKNLKILAIDQDADAILNGKKRVHELQFENRVQFIQGNFNESHEEIKKIIHGKKVLIVLADLGVSSHHFDEAQRGFSFKHEGPLDMRMNQSQKLTAALIIKEYSEQELVEIFTELGEEPFAKKIAKEIVSQRKTNPIETTLQLEEICFRSYPVSMRHRGKHPALRVFQALRIEVNNELGVLKNSLPFLFESLSVEGRMGIITFHSLEDRIVKHTFLNWSKELYSDKCKILTKKPIIPGQEEIIYNPRSRSAKLRVLEKTFETL